jgi:hypothetical protein
VIRVVGFDARSSTGSAVSGSGRTRRSLIAQATATIKDAIKTAVMAAIATPIDPVAFDRPLDGAGRTR